ncbi:MAG: helix-turn-helix domain-containing protein, partial [Planctomycetota bacterium]
MDQKYLTTGQAAIRCSVSPDTVLKWIRSGLLPARKTAGGHHRINERDLDRVLNQSEFEH